MIDPLLKGPRVLTGTGTSGSSSTRPASYVMGSSWVFPDLVSLGPTQVLVGHQHPIHFQPMFGKWTRTSSCPYRAVSEAPEFHFRCCCGINFALEPTLTQTRQITKPINLKRCQGDLGRVKRGRPSSGAIFKIHMWPLTEVPHPTKQLSPPSLQGMNLALWDGQGDLPEATR